MKHTSARQQRRNGKSRGKEARSMANGYIGKVSHSGVQKVTAPNPATGKKGNGTVKKGNDLRTGK